MQETKKKKTPKLKAVIVLMLLFVGIYVGLEVLRWQVRETDNVDEVDRSRRIDLMFRDKIELKVFQDIVAGCEADLFDKYRRNFVEGEAGERQISNERYKQLVEECVNERNKNDSIRFTYDEE